MFNEGVRVGGKWEAAEKRCTLAQQKVNVQHFKKGYCSLQCTDCSSSPLLKIEMDHLCLCILYCCMAMGRLLSEFIQAMAVILKLAQQLHGQNTLQQQRTGLSLKGLVALDGEEA